MATDNYSIYQNHPLDSFINVSVHYMTISPDGLSMQPSDAQSCNATIYSVRDITNDKRWYVCEIHMTDKNIHGTMTAFNRKSATKALTKAELLKEIKTFLERALLDNKILEASASSDTL